MKIAVCDKDAEYLQKLKLMLTEIFAENNLQAEMNCFTDSKTFLAYLAEHKVDMVILDLVLDKLNGIEAARKMRQLQGEKPKLIFVSSINSYAAETYEVNTAGFLLKPVTEISVKKLFVEILRKKEGR